MKEQPNAAAHGFLTLILLAGVITTSVMIFFGGEKYWPFIFLAGLFAHMTYYALRKN